MFHDYSLYFPSEILRFLSDENGHYATSDMNNHLKIIIMISFSTLFFEHPYAKLKTTQSSTSPSYFGISLNVEKLAHTPPLPVLFLWLLYICFWLVLVNILFKMWCIHFMFAKYIWIFRHFMLQELLHFLNFLHMKTEFSPQNSGYMSKYFKYTLVKTNMHNKVVL